MAMAQSIMASHSALRTPNVRRWPASTRQVKACGEWRSITFHRGTAIGRTARRQARLTPKEHDLLSYLLARPNRTIVHRELLQAVWGPDYGDELEYLRVFINRLRKKIEPNPSKPRFLLTDAWAGYRFQLPE